jgi:hypothetical protein
MAQKITTVLEDDLDGGEAVETVLFGLDGATYEIDLNAANAARLREALADYVNCGRLALKEPAKAKTRSIRPSTRRRPTQEMREWARDNGYLVREMGRVPGHVVAAYEAAHA